MWRARLRTPSLTQARESTDATSGCAKAGNGFPKLDDAKYTVIQADPDESGFGRGLTSCGPRSILISGTSIPVDQ